MPLVVKRCGVPCAEDYPACVSVECILDCISTFEEGCATDGACSPLSYPFTLPFCVPSTINLEPLFCPCGEPDAATVVTMTVRLMMSGLTIGQDYEATVNWRRVDDLEITGSYTWAFTATAAEENTAYTAVPNPAGVNEPGWQVFSCNVVPV